MPNLGFVGLVDSPAVRRPLCVGRISIDSDWIRADDPASIDAGMRGVESLPQAATAAVIAFSPNE
jgi:hypothetical protein